MTAVGFGSKLLALSVLLTLGARGLLAQSQVISLAAAAASTLTVTVQSGAVQTIAGVTDNAINNFPTPVVIQTAWNVNPGQTNTVNLVAYFSIPAQAMTGGAVQIPVQPDPRTDDDRASRCLYSHDAECHRRRGLGGRQPRLCFRSTSVDANKNASRTDNLDLRLDLVGFPTLPAGAYAGVLNIRAVTQ